MYFVGLHYRVAFSPTCIGKSYGWERPHGEGQGGRPTGTELAPKKCSDSHWFSSFLRLPPPFTPFSVFQSETCRRMSLSERRVQLTRIHHYLRVISELPFPAGPSCPNHAVCPSAPLLALPWQTSLVAVCMSLSGAPKKQLLHVELVQQGLNRQSDSKLLALSSPVRAPPACVQPLQALQP